LYLPNTEIELQLIYNSMLLIIITAILVYSVNDATSQLLQLVYRVIFINNIILPEYRKDDEVQHATCHQQQLLLNTLNGKQ